MLIKDIVRVAIVNVTIVNVFRDRQFSIAFIYFYCLLFAYYLLRPVREEVGILHGVGNLQWLYTATFIVMLLIVPVFGWCKNTFSRRMLTVVVYGMFAINLLVFYFWFQADMGTVWLARVFFVWLSVFNMFAVSVFWSVMADLHEPKQAIVLFAPISAAGSLGGISGSWVTARFVDQMGVANLMIVASALLVIVMICSTWLISISATQHHAKAKQNGSVLDGATALLRSKYLRNIAWLALIYSVVASLMYFIQAQLVSDHIADSTERTRFFAHINLTINIIALIFQFIVTSAIVRRFGVEATFGGVLAVVGLSVLVLGIWPALMTLAVTQVVLRAGQFGAMKPCFDMLFSVVSQEQKYKSKNFIDTSLVRAGDLTGAWLFTALKGLGLSVSMITYTTAILVTALGFIAVKTGKLFDVRRSAQDRSRH